VLTEVLSEKMSDHRHHASERVRPSGTERAGRGTDRHEYTAASSLLSILPKDVGTDLTIADLSFETTIDAIATSLADNAMDTEVDESEMADEPVHALRSLHVYARGSKLVNNLATSSQMILTPDRSTPSRPPSSNSYAMPMPKPRPASSSS
jgi:hypothetical protein